MKQRRVLPRILAGILIAAILSACQSGEPASQPEALITTSTSEGTTTTTTAATPSRQDVSRAMERLLHYLTEWNSAGLRWVAAYSDDTVSHEEYLEVSHETELTYRRLIADLVLDSKRFPIAMQGATTGLVENFQGRVAAFHRVIQADILKDDDAWNDAAAEYYEYANPDAVYQMLEEFFRTSHIEAALAEEGANVDDLLEALAAAMAQPIAPAVAPMNVDAFLRAMDRIDEFAIGWKSAFDRWFIAYSDDAVSYEEYLEVSYETEQTYRRLNADLAMDLKRFPTAMQGATNRVLENFQGRATAFNRMILAEFAPGNDAWEAAVEDFYKYAHQDAVREMSEEFYRTPEIEATFAEIGVSVDDVLDSTAASFGIG